MNAAVVDRAARNAAAQCLRQFASGRITNFALERCWPDSPDPVLRALGSTVWCFYDDFREHRLQGPFALSPTMRRAVSRWILFLHTDEPYVWPDVAFPGVRPLRRHWLARGLGLLGVIARKERRFLASGDIAVWPFACAQDFDRARKRPRLLSGLVAGHGG